MIDRVGFCELEEGDRTLIGGFAGEFGGGLMSWDLILLMWV